MCLEVRKRERYCNFFFFLTAILSFEEEGEDVKGEKKEKKKEKKRKERTKKVNRESEAKRYRQRHRQREVS